MTKMILKGATAFLLMSIVFLPVQMDAAEADYSEIAVSQNV